MMMKLSLVVVALLLVAQALGMEPNDFAANLADRRAAHEDSTGEAVSAYSQCITNKCGSVIRACAEEKCGSEEDQGAYEDCTREKCTQTMTNCAKEKCGAE